MTDSLFYTHYWNMVARDVVEEVRDFFIHKNLPMNLDKANIVLLTKKSNSISVNDYRPINLCNFVYKIIMKLSANRLKALLPKMVSPLQSVFVGGRVITNNSIVTHEILTHNEQEERQWGVNVP